MRIHHRLFGLGALLSFAHANRERIFDEVTALRLEIANRRDVFSRNDSLLTERKAAPAKSAFLNDRSKKFVVNGKALPLVSFDVGESYAGLLPISSKPDETRKLFFWFFPSQNPAAKGEIAVWFNGGPGCSSLGGLLEENGPLLWQPGTRRPTKNPYGWSKLTNYVWIEQFVGVGYSEGKPDISNERQLAIQFAGFWKNFVDTFGLKKHKTGESYAGNYVPCIASEFLKREDDDYFNIKGIALNDPLIGDDTLQHDVPLLQYVAYWEKILYLSQKDQALIRSKADSCGYSVYMEKYFKFPPPPKPWPDLLENCLLFLDVARRAGVGNPCFNIYHITDTCPLQFAHLGVSPADSYVPPGAQNYFNRQDVKRALNVPHAGDWSLCVREVFFQGQDRSPGPALDGTLDSVIERLNNTVIGSGALDMLLPTNGTLFALQNLTWNGAQGFHAYPSTPFIVPYHFEPNEGAMAGSGQIGVWREERGLTFYEVHLAGHQLPGHSASGGYCSIELLLGRIPSLSVDTPFSGGGFDVR